MFQLEPLVVLEKLISPQPELPALSVTSSKVLYFRRGVAFLFVSSHAWLKVFDSCCKRSSSCQLMFSHVHADNTLDQLGISTGGKLEFWEIRFWVWTQHFRLPFFFFVTVKAACCHVLLQSEFLIIIYKMDAQVSKEKNNTNNNRVLIQPLFSYLDDILFFCGGW